MKTYVYQDDSGDEMRVYSPDGCHASVSVSADNAYIPAHRLAEVVTAMYEAAGQPAPDLPDIPDAEQVKALASLLHFARHGTHADTLAFRAEARVLLAHGVTVPEVTS